MTDIRDPHPDSPPEADNDRRSDVERAVDQRPDDVERGSAGDEAPMEPTGADDGNAGTGGLARNQDLAE